jgi:iodotyrosine deiodinase
MKERSAMPAFIPYHSVSYSEEEQLRRVRDLFAILSARRSIREFSPRPVSRELLEWIVRTAASAPSGANKQPWTFVVVTDPQLKRDIRAAAEKEERESYAHRMPDSWLQDLEPLGVDWHKPFLEIAPALIVVFQKNYDVENGTQRKNYYVRESVGIACGFLLAAIQQAGLAALTHTPSPMDFLSNILQRPEEERPFLLIPVGYAADGTRVPDISRKDLHEISVWQ